MDIKDALPAVPPPDTTPAPKEQPLVELRWKTWLFALLLLTIIWCIWLFSFGTIVRYLTTGNFAEIWPAREYDILEKQVLFVFAWIFWLGSPVLFQLFRLGVVALYETHVEQRPYLWFIKKATIPYDEMHVTDKNQVMTLTKGGIPKWRESLYKYCKAKYLESITIPSNGMVLSNPEALPQAIKLVRERAFKINKS
jgi:hypothetical protein